LPEKAGNVQKFDSCQKKSWEIDKKSVKWQGTVGETSRRGKLYIVIFTSDVK